MSISSRRDVIKTLAFGTGGLILSPKILRSTNIYKKDRLGIALVGLGYYSTDLLAPALQQTKNCYLAGIVTGTPSKAETWKGKTQHT
jgi:glucose-fructose oxidoreductase